MIGRRYQKPGSYPPAHPMALREYLRLQAVIDAAIERVTKIMRARVHRWADIEMRVDGAQFRAVNSITWTPEPRQNTRKTGVLRGICEVRMNALPPMITIDAGFKVGS